MQQLVAVALKEYGRIELVWRLRGPHLHLGTGSKMLQRLAHSPDRCRAHRASTANHLKARIMIAHV